MTDKVPALLLNQGDRKLIVFSLSAEELRPMCYFNTREIDREDGVQRAYNKKRSREIAAFVETEDACLANNIIINLELEALGLCLGDVYDASGGTLDIARLRQAAAGVSSGRLPPLKGKCAFVVDGQHRLRAFEFVKRRHFSLVVTALIDLSLAEVAELFVQINYNQKPVNKSLVFDLLGISKNVFPEYYELHKLAVDLNEDVNSPFYRHLKMLGTGPGSISQASLITAVERYRLREKLSVMLKKQPAPDVLYDVIWNFYTGVGKAFPDQWKEGGRLCKTIGTRALFRVMCSMLEKFQKAGMPFESSVIAGKLRHLNIDDLFTRARGFGGEKGVSELSELMLEGLGLNK